MKKKILSLFLSVALLVAACSVMAACGDEDVTTEAPIATNDTTTPEATTTEATTVATTTEATTVATTTEATTIATTTEATTVATTTEATTTTETTTTTTGETTTIKMNTVLDFVGNNATALKVLENATYDKSAISIEAEKDSIVIYSSKNFEKDVDTAATYSVTYSLKGFDTLKSGFGTYEGRPWYVSTDADWQGAHQYMALSIKGATGYRVNADKDETLVDLDNKYVVLTFNFEDGKNPVEITIDTSTIKADKDGNKVAVIDLVKETANGTFTSTTMPKSKWSLKSREVESITVNFFGATVTKEKDDTAFAPQAGDSITLNYIVFGSDFESINNYGVKDAE